MTSSKTDPIDQLELVLVEIEKTQKSNKESEDDIILKYNLLNVRLDKIKAKRARRKR